MKKLKIGVDLDNVLAETGQYVAQLVAIHYMPGFTVDQYTSWNLTDCTEMTHEQQEDIYQILHTELQELDEVEGAGAAMDLLGYLGHFLHIVTHRPVETMMDTAKWWADQNIIYSQLDVCNDKSIFFKDIDLLIDDSPSIAMKAVEMGRPVFLYDRPWNQGISHPLITRVANWSEILFRLGMTTVFDTNPNIPVDDILAEAYKLTSGDRQQQYGHPYDDFTKTGKLWAALLDLESPIPPHKVAEMMMLVKMSRIEKSPDNPDHWTDAAGYSRCGWLCRIRERELKGGTGAT